MILDQIVAATKIRVEAAKHIQSLSEIKSKLQDLQEGKGRNDTEEDALGCIPKEKFIFEKAIQKDGMSFICEVKKASPSKGIIAREFPYMKIAEEYEEAGADAISVLTEPDYFMGSNDYLTKISRKSSIPILRKDFVLDEYQLYEAKLIGADAVLLICTLLTQEKIKYFLSICEELGLSALVEAHTEEEVKRAVRAGAKILGVNHRNLQTFEVDIKNSIRLRNLVKGDVLFVAESGIQTREDVIELENAGVNAVLIGETLMRSDNKRLKLSNLRGYDI